MLAFRRVTMYSLPYTAVRTPAAGVPIDVLLQAWHRQQPMFLNMAP